MRNHNIKKSDVRCEMISETGERDGVRKVVGVEGPGGGVGVGGGKGKGKGENSWGWDGS